MQRKVIVETDGPVAELGLSRNGTGDGGDTGEPEHWQYVGPRPETELFPELELGGMRDQRGCLSYVAALHLEIESSPRALGQKRRPAYYFGDFRRNLDNVIPRHSRNRLKTKLHRPASGW